MVMGAQIKIETGVIQQLESEKVKKLVVIVITVIAPERKGKENSR